jgi:hypothetical protein
MVFLATLAGFVLHNNSGRWRCYRNLIWIDHALNCNGCIQMGRSQGFIDQEGHWKMDDSNFLLQTLNTNNFACPVSGHKYAVTYVIGTHPRCPTHGDLIQYYGHSSHQMTFKSSFWHLAPVVSAIGAIACGVWALMPFMARPPTPPPT